MVASIPNNLSEVIEILKTGNCRIVAGATDFMVKNKKKSRDELSKKRYILISSIEDLKKIEVIENKLKIGACATCSEIIDSPIVPQFIKDVIETMASPAIRNTATLGGNICNASPVGDSLPLLYALEAKLLIASNKEEKLIPIEEFIKGPGKIILEEYELLKEIVINLSDFNKIYFKKVGTRNSIALAKLSFFGMAKINENNGIEDIKLSFGAVAPTIVKNKDLEQKIVSLKTLTKDHVEEILTNYRELIKPITDQRSDEYYRKEVSLRLLKTFLENIRSL